MFNLFVSEKTRVKRALDKFKFPEGFEDRLRRENGWSEYTTTIAILEYKKYLYLAKFYGSATPSKIVDTVWHLHLLYTDSYWNDLCKKVLKANIHHAPSSGSKLDEKKYSDQYVETKSQYQSEFGVAPDPMIWGGSDVSTPSISSHDSFGGGSFGGSGAGSDWGSSDSSTSDSSHSSCSSDSGGSSCGSSCGGSCGGGGD